MCGPGIVPSSIAAAIATSTNPWPPTVRMPTTPESSAKATAFDARSVASGSDTVWLVSGPVHRCACASTRPGMTVYARRSSSSAPGGIARPAPTPVMIPSVMMIVASCSGGRAASAISVPQRTASTCGAPETATGGTRSATDNRATRRLVMGGSPENSAAIVVGNGAPGATARRRAHADWLIGLPDYRFRRRARAGIPSLGPRCRLCDAKLACSLETAAQDFASSTLR